jgi:WD40 repeat protein/uncharacterized caspase-like protein
MDLAFDPAGKWISAALSDGTLRVMDASNSHLIAIAQQDVEHSDPLLAVVVSPDGKLLASGGVGNNIVVYNTSSWTIVGILPGHTDWVRVLAFSPNGKTLASGSDDKTVKLWCTERGANFGDLRRTISGNSEVDALAFSPNGQLLAYGNENSEVRVLLAETSEQRTTFRSTWPGGLSMPIDLEHQHLRMMKWGSGRIAFSPDGRQLARGVHVVEVWNIDNGKSTLLGREISLANPVVSPDGNFLAIELGYVVQLWDLRSGHPVRQLWALTSRPRGAPSTGAVSSITFSPDGNDIASGYQSGLVVLWDVKTGRLLRSLDPYKPGIVSGLAISADGRLLAVATQNNLVTLWDVRSGVEVRRLPTQETPFNTFHTVAFSLDGRVLATAAWNEKSILLWDTATGDQVGQLEAEGAACLGVNPVTGSLVAGGNFGLKVWQGAQWKTSHTLPGHRAWVNHVSFSPDGSLLASGSADNTVKIWNFDKERELDTFVGYPEGVSFSRDSKWLISADKGSVAIRNASTGEIVSVLASVGLNEWLVSTPGGLFDGSAGAWTSMIWRFGSSIFDVLPIEAFFSEFYYPGLLADIIADKRPGAPHKLAEVDRRQPVVRITLSDPVTVGSISSRTISLVVEVASAPPDSKHPKPSGVRDVRLFRNGSLVRIWHGEAADKTQYRVRLPIVAGTNRFTAYAFNDSNVKTKDVQLSVNGADNLVRAGVAYIVAVGVNKYGNSDYNLHYAAQDARAFADELKHQQIRLDHFARVQVIPLFDADATKANILAALSELAGAGPALLSKSSPAALASVRAAEPEDAVFVYFAGHGTSAKSHFYLIPHDLGYQGKRDELDEDRLNLILQHSISDEELRQAFEGIDAGKLVLIIDACNSGQALEAEEKRRGPMNSKGLAQLAYEKGMYVLTATQSYQAALEVGQFGHGLLTYALIEEALKNSAAEVSPSTAELGVREWLDYAAARVPELQRTFLSQSRQLEHGIEQTALESQGRAAQEPRVFYRRESDDQPLIIAKRSIKP